MELERRALYNLLRMTWLQDSSTQVESWQIEDYRQLPTDVIFDRIDKLGIPLDNVSFLSNAEVVDTPEGLTDLLLEDADLNLADQDQAYLLIFELWRRLLPEKLCLSIFCDELDHQIFLFDLSNQQAEVMQDLIANLQIILDENTDQGADPTAVFMLVCVNCANDLGNFLYDFICEQIDDENIGYASELVEGFEAYLEHSSWFELLKIRLLNLSDPETAKSALKKLVQKAAKQSDLEFNFEILSFISRVGDSTDFHKIVKITIPLLETEEDFQDLLTLCADYYRLLDQDEKEGEIDSILQKRLSIHLKKEVSQSDPDLRKFLTVIK
jgi:hypothetical protein